MTKVEINQIAYTAGRESRVGPPCGLVSNRSGSCLILSLRHMGDVVISTGFIRALQKANPNLSVDVLGRPELNEVFAAMCPVRQYVEIDLPVFGHHRKDRAAMRAAFSVIVKLRRHRYDYCVNLIGDVRECFVGWLLKSTWNIAPIWGNGHLYKDKMTDRFAPLFVNCGVVIPGEIESYYDSLTYFAGKLGLSDLDWQHARQRVECAGSRCCIALHPGASHPSRHWPVAKWKQLMNKLYARGNDLVLFGAPRECGRLRADFADEIQDLKMAVVAGDIARFRDNLSQVDLLIGMDSFSVHLAHALSLQTVVLNGSSDPRILAPPGSIGISAGHLCEDYPCNYKYPCKSQTHEYICCRGIEVDAVIDAVEQLKRDAPRERRSR